MPSLHRLKKSENLNLKQAIVCPVFECSMHAWIILPMQSIYMYSHQVMMYSKQLEDVLKKLDVLEKIILQ